MTEPLAVSSRRRFFGRLLAAWTGGALFGTVGRPRRASARVQAVQPYVGEIRMFAGTYAPDGWMFCEGQLIAISDNETLFSVIGTSYGGDGQTTFALPDLRGRAPMHHGAGVGLTPRTLAESGGAEAVTLTLAQLPPHTHPAAASSGIGTSDAPAGRVPARNAAGVPTYGTAPKVSLASGALAPAGGSLAHPNMQPYLGMHYIISLFGTYPSPT